MIKKIDFYIKNQCFLWPSKQLKIFPCELQPPLDFMGLDGIEQSGYLWCFQLSHWFPELEGGSWILSLPLLHTPMSLLSFPFLPTSRRHTFFFLGRPRNHRFWCLKPDRDQWCHVSSIPRNYICPVCHSFDSFFSDFFVGFYTSLIMLMHQYGMVYPCSRVVMEGERMEEVDRKNEENGGFCSFWLKFTWV